MTAALEGGEWSAARTGRTLPPGKTRYPFYRREGGWAPGPVWTNGKSRPHRDSIPDRPARSSVAIPTELPGPLVLLLHTYIHICSSNNSNNNNVCVHTYTHTHTYLMNARLHVCGVKLNWAQRIFYIYTSHLYLHSFLGSLTQLRKATISSHHVRPSVRPHGTTRLPLDGFPWNLIFECFSKTHREN